MIYRYCNNCAKTHNWPTDDTSLKVFGECGFCEFVGPCFERHHSKLKPISRPGHEPNEASKQCTHGEDDHALGACLKCDCDLHGAYVAHGLGVGK